MSVPSLLTRLQTDYPGFVFRAGTKFKFRPPKTIYYETLEASKSSRGEDTASQAPEASKSSRGEKTASQAPEASRGEEMASNCFLLHELGHAILGHRDFKTAPERLRKEVEAWGVAKKIAPSYGIAIDDKLVQSELDSYRDWLQSKSRCPHCSLTRYQTTDGVWHCPYCEAFLKR